MHLEPVRQSAIAILFALTSACVVTDDGDDGGSGEGGSAEGGSAEGGSGGDVEPQSGSWIYDEQSVEDGCGINPSNGYGEFTVDNTGGGMFTIDPSDGTEPFDCSISGRSFSCPERLQEEEDYADAGYDAVVSWFVSASGSLSSSTEMDPAQQDGRIECAGSDCGLAEAVFGVDVPCDFTIHFRGTKL